MASERTWTSRHPHARDKSWTEKTFLGRDQLWAWAKCGYCGVKIAVASGWPGTPICDECFAHHFGGDDGE